MFYFFKFWIFYKHVSIAQFLIVFYIFLLFSPWQQVKQTNKNVLKTKINK